MTIQAQRVGTGAERKVLIVDDEPHILSAIQDLLEDDFAVLAVTDAEVALRLLEDEEVSVILSDQRMPGLSGDQFLREAQKRSRAIRVLITGYADLHALVSAVNEGKIYGYVAKPWEPEELRSLVSKAADYFALVQDLEHERTLLHTLMDNIPDHIYFKDVASRYTRVNSAMASAMGLRDPRAAIGKTAADFLPESTRQLHENEKRIIELAQPLVDQIEEVREEGGKNCWYSTTKVPIRDKQGAVTGLVGISRDITQRKQAEEALYKREEDFRFLFVNNPCPMWTYDLETLQFVEINEAAIALYGYSRDEFLQMRITDIRPPEEVSYLLERLKGKRPELQASGSWKHRTKEGRIMDVEITSRTLELTGRKMVLVVAQDTTERKNLEQQLRQAQKLETIGQLAGGIAHDFNNLLTIIDGYSALQLRRMGPDQPQYESLQEIQKAADRGAGLIRQLLAFSRKQVLEPKVLDLNAVVKNLEKMLHRLIGEDVELVVRLASGSGQVKADPGQVEQVLMNLAINARDAMPRGGTLLIETRSVELDEGYTFQHVPVTPGPYVLLEVSDTGVGMDEATQVRIFEPFFTTKEPGKGTGLGLSTVYGIIKQSGGYIWVYSEPGKGTSFKIYLPRVAEEVQAVVQEEVVQRARGSETVLLVEDEAPLRQLAALLLREQGYTVLEAGRGEEALECSAQHQERIHLVMSDMVMPGMSGPELVEQLLVLRPELKVMYVSGYSADMVGQRVALKPGTAFLQKPFKTQALLLKVREALDG